MLELYYYFRKLFWSWNKLKKMVGQRTRQECNPNIVELRNKSFNYQKFLGVQNPFFKKGFARRRQLFFYILQCF